MCDMVSAANLYAFVTNPAATLAKRIGFIWINKKTITHEAWCQIETREKLLYNKKNHI